MAIKPSECRWGTAQELKRWIDQDPEIQAHLDQLMAKPNPFLERVLRERERQEIE